MSQKIGVLIIHGMGSQRPGFADGLVEELRDRLGSLAGRFEWQPIHWADRLEERETALLESMREALDPAGRRLRLDWRAIREFVVHNFGDAVAYHRDSRRAGTRTAYYLVHKVIDRHVRGLDARLGDPGAPIVVLAHSLGAHMISNYLWDRQKRRQGDRMAAIPTLAGIVSFGCNIPLFSLAYDVAKPILVPGRGVRKPELVETARWLNFFDRDDVLGWPLKPLYSRHLQRLNKGQRATVERIEDREINVGSLAFSWNPGAHAAYWTDNDFTRPVARYLRTLVAALDA